MASTIGGDDADHGLDAEKKDKEERKLREEALELLRRGKKKERTKKLNRANEISRKKSKRAHKGTD
jgi:hypothetical protein